MEHVNAEILRAIADGEKVQYRDVAKGEDWACTGPWKDFDVKSIEACFNLLAGYPVVEWRIAPETIKIGDFEVPAPCRKVPEIGQKIWVVDPFCHFTEFTWNGNKACHLALEGGFVHLTKEAARQHYEAIKSLLVK